jgi:hypothetical protein
LVKKAREFLDRCDMTPSHKIASHDRTPIFWRVRDSLEMEGALALSHRMMMSRRYHVRSLGH